MINYFGYFIEAVTVSAIACLCSYAVFCDLDRIENVEAIKIAVDERYIYISFVSYGHYSFTDDDWSL